LKAIDEASGASHGITDADLLAAEGNALRQINQFVIRVAGPRRGAEIVAFYMDDGETLDPLIPQLAELIAAAEILERWERFNRSDEGPDGQVRRKDSSDVRGRATRIAQDIMDAGGTLASDKTFRRWYRPKGQQGPRVEGPMVNGSYFDPKGYTDPWGRQFPGYPDPFGVAHL
jgi:hypothetical protein